MILAKMRGIKPEAFTDDKMLRLSPLARWLFVGMWTLACDNGHVEDNLIQLKVRLLPMDSCDVGDLVNELLDTGQIQRLDGYLKVAKLAEHQRIDRRYLTLCEWCAHDVHTTFKADDKAPRHPSTQRVHDGHPTGTQRVHDVEGEKKVRGEEGEGERKDAPAMRATRIPDDFALTDELRAWAKDKGLDHLNLDAILEEFFDYWRSVPGAKGTKLDWPATFRGWVRRKADDVKVRPIRYQSSEDKAWGY
mgnify:CR=1 FL=1